jgi:glucose/mannose-6-phosphate isomerase
MPDIDDPTMYAALDHSRMGDRLSGLPEQCAAAWRQARNFSLPGYRSPIDRIVIGGMGGSAIAGDLVADLAGLHPGLPVVVVRTPAIPFALNRNSLVIACSYSGETKETLSLFHQATQAGASVLAVAGGGSLMKEAKARRIPVLSIDITSEPRNAVIYNLMLLLGILENLSLMRTTEEEVLAGTQALRQQVSRLRLEVAAIDNPAKQLARELVGKLVVVYGGGIFSGVAQRWKTQINENAKTWAFFETLPELLHNSVEAYGAPRCIGEGVLAVVLRPKSAEEWVNGGYSVLADLLRQNNIPHRIVDGGDGPPLAQLLDMLLLGDYTSYYLALIRGMDPSPTPNINLVKERLAARQPADPV